MSSIDKKKLMETDKELLVKIIEIQNKILNAYHEFYMDFIVKG